MENELTKRMAQEYVDHTGKYYAVLLFEKAGNLGEDEIPPHVYLCTNKRYFNNGVDALSYYANTPCPASQLLDANTEEELNDKITEMIINYQDENWLNENLYPYM